MLLNICFQLLFCWPSILFFVALYFPLSYKKPVSLSILIGIFKYSDDVMNLFFLKASICELFFFELYKLLFLLLVAHPLVLLVCLCLELLFFQRYSLITFFDAIHMFDYSFQLLFGIVFLVSCFLFYSICFSVPFFLFPFYVPVNLVLIALIIAHLWMREFLLDLLFRGGSPGRSQKLLTPGQQEIPLVCFEVPSDKGLWVN